MFIQIEPVTGTELERMITALLNATGVMHRTLESTPWPDGRDGEEFIGDVAERVRGVLSPMTEHRDDDELAEITAALGEITLRMAEELGLRDCFDAPG